MVGLVIILTAIFYLCAFFFALIGESCKSLSESKIEELAAEKNRKINLEYYLKNTDRSASAAEALKLILNICFVSGFWITFLLLFPASGNTAAFMWALGVAVVAYGLIGLMNFLTYSLAKYKGESILLRLFPVANAVGIILWPISTFAKSLNGAAARLFARSESRPGNRSIAEDIMQVVDVGEREGVIPEEEAEMIESAVSFRNLRVTEVMTPRIEMVCVKGSLTLEQAKELVMEKGHSRVPVFDKNRDDIIGILYVKDMLRFSHDEFTRKSVRDIMRKAYYVPEMKRIGELLKEFKSHRIHIAIVLDEYGGTAGLITIEDIIEEIFGEIEDEYDFAKELPVKKISPTAVEVNGNAHISDINEELGLHLPEDEEYETITGFIFKNLGRVPKAGEKLKYRDFSLTVMEATERKVKKIQIELPGQEISSQ